MTPGVRKLALTTHVAASVGWLGAVGCFLALAAAACAAPPARRFEGAANSAPEPMVESESDPVVLGALLETETYRFRAARRLRQTAEFLWRSPHASGASRRAVMRRFIGPAIPQLVRAFIAHAEDAPTRIEAVVVFDRVHDPRAVPALISALEPPHYGRDRGALELGATRVLLAYARAGEVPEAERARAIAALTALALRPAGLRDPVPAREVATEALGVLRGSEVADAGAPAP